MFFCQTVPSSSTRLACSMESMPAWMAHLMPWVPWAWAAILRPVAWAVSAAIFEFFESCIARRRAYRPAQDPARREDLDHIDAVLDLGADGLAHLLGAVGDREVALVGEHHDAGLRRIVVEVAVAAGDRDAGPGGDDARAGNESCIDAVAEIDREKRQRADVANGGEAGVESLLGVDHPGDGGIEGRVFEVPDGVVAVGAGAQMGVAVDQARKDVGVGEICYLRAWRNCESGGFDRLDALTFDDEHHVGVICPALAVKQFASFDVGGLRGLSEGGEGRQREQA